MEGITLIDILLIFMIIGSIIAIETKNLLSSVIAVGAVGFGLSIIFLMLRAPDVAITQVVVEILCLIILIRATIMLDNTTIAKHKDTFAMIAGLIFFGLFLAFAYMAFLHLPAFGTPIMKVSKEYLVQALEKTRAANVVTSILLDFRGYDTLGEATVLFASVIGAFAILRRKGRKDKKAKQ